MLEGVQGTEMFKGHMGKATMVTLCVSIRKTANISLKFKIKPKTLRKQREL